MLDQCVAVYTFSKSYSMSGWRLGFAVAGGECFGEAGAGFLRLSCAEPNERLRQAVEFLPTAFAREGRVASFLDQNPAYRLETPYANPTDAPSPLVTFPGEATRVNR